MINILPLKEKKELLLEKNKKLTIILGIVVLVCLVWFALILLLLKIYISEEIRQQEIILNDSKKKYEVFNFSSLENIVKKYNADLEKVNNFYSEEKYFSDAIRVIFAIERPVDLRMENIFLERNEKNGRINAAISGLSGNRENLLRFKDDLTDNSKIENVYFPPDNWTKEANIDFNSTFIVNLGE